MCFATSLRKDLILHVLASRSLQVQNSLCLDACAARNAYDTWCSQMDVMSRVIMLLGKGSSHVVVGSELTANYCIPMLRKSISDFRPFLRGCGDKQLKAYSHGRRTAINHANAAIIAVEHIMTTHFGTSFSLLCSLWLVISIVEHMPQLSHEIS